MNTAKHTAPRLATPTDLGANATKDIAGALNALLADTFALYLKTKNFHWHISGPHFRDYHLLLDEQADQIFAMTDVLAERVRKVGGDDAALDRRHLAPAAPRRQRRALCRSRTTCWRNCATTISVSSPPCARRTTSATSMTTSPRTSLLEVYIDETERRVWFLYEAGRHGDPSGH